MSEWKEYKLGELVTIVNGFAFKSHDFMDSGGDDTLPVVKIKNVANGDVHLNDVKYYSISADLSKFIVSKGEILMALTGNHPELETQVVGLTSRYKLNQKAYVNQRVAKIESKNKAKMLDDYLYYFLKDDNTHQYLASQSSGSANQANISKSDIENAPIELPGIDTQRNISETLKSLDDKIDLLHRQNKTLEELAETLFRQWFAEEVEDSWAETSLQAQTEVFRGLSYKGSGLAEEGNGIPMHNLNSVYEGGGYKLDGIKFYNGEYRDRHVIKPGEIIVANTEQGHEHKLIGFPAIVPDYYGDLGLFSQHIYKLKTLPESYLSNEFLYYLLMTHSMREQIIGATNGSTVNMLAIDGLQRPEFRLPPIEKIMEYTEIVKNYWKKKNSNNNQIRTLTGLRDTLLPKLMSGELKLNGTP